MTSALDDLLGRVRRLTVRRFGPPGAFLGLDPGSDHARSDHAGTQHAPGALGESLVLLPRADVPESARVGECVEVFLHLDSQDRPFATTRRPRLERGEVAFLAVTDVTRVGAFVDWGLPKELLVPFAEQTRELRPGERHPIGLYLDSSGRLAGTMRIREMLDVGKGAFEQDEWVEGEAWRNDPEHGLFVIVERAHVGRVPASEPHRLGRGEAARFRVTNVLFDGRIELSLRGHGHQELEADAQRLLDALGRGAPRLGDRSPPEAIRGAFGLSKKAFKRAAGRLLRDGLAVIDEDGSLALRAV